MKKAMVVLGVATAMSSVAHAQSTVSLYGLVDTGIDYVNNSGGGKLFQMQDGGYTGLAGSRWGLTGVEDLGDGYKAIFKLENGFNEINGKLGAGGGEFGRQSYVGVSSDRFGTLTLGRQYDSVVDDFGPLTFTHYYGGIFYHAGDIDNAGNSFRVNNAVKYTSPILHGISFTGLYAFTNSNDPGVGTTGMWSVGANYTSSSLYLGAAYFFAKNPAVFLPGGDFLPNTTGNAIGATGSFSYVGNPSNAQVFGFGANYLIRNTTIGLNFSQAKFDNANGTASSVIFNNYEAWASVAITPAFNAGVRYTFSDGKVNYSGQSPKYHQVGAGLKYALSKTTTLYATADFEKAAGDAKVADIAEGIVGTASTTDKQLVTRIGIMHKF